MVEYQPAIIGIAQGKKYSCFVPRRMCWTAPRIFERFPSHLKRDTVLWIKFDRLARRNAKETSVESCYVGEKCTVSRVHFAGRIGIRIVVIFNLPSGSRNLGDGTQPSGKKFSSTTQHRKPPRKPQANSDDRNGFQLRPFEFLYPSFEGTDFVERLFNRRQSFGLRFRWT